MAEMRDDLTDAEVAALRGLYEAIGSECESLWPEEFARALQPLADALADLLVADQPER